MSTQPQPQSSSPPGMITAGYILAFLIPFVGFIIGVIVLTRNQIGSGIAITGLSLFMVVMYAALLAGAS